MINNQQGTKLKVFKIDNGLGFVLGKVNDIFREKGIKRHKTIVGTPQKNGLAKRMNKTILER